MRSYNAIHSTFSQQLIEEPIPHLARGGFHTQTLRCSACSDIAALFVPTGSACAAQEQPTPPPFRLAKGELQIPSRLSSAFRRREHQSNDHGRSAESGRSPCNPENSSGAHTP